MLDLYTWPTPNGHKVHIMLEELGAAYNMIRIDIQAGEQFSPDVLRISPSNKMPALVDHDGPDGAWGTWPSNRRRDVPPAFEGSPALRSRRER